MKQPRTAIAAIVAACLLAAPAPAETPESVQHLICSAYFGTMAWVRSREGHHEEAGAFGEWAAIHAAWAIQLDKAAGLQAWATRDMVSQLTAKLKIAAHENGTILMQQKHQYACEFLSNKTDQRERANRFKR